jgi:Ala-tRNA(Pro) deacylase
VHCKNLFIKDRKGGIWLMVLPADKRADLGRLEKALGAPRLSFARPDMLQEVLALTPARVGDAVRADQRHATARHRDL